MISMPGILSGDSRTKINFRHRLEVIVELILFCQFIDHYFMGSAVSLLYSPIHARVAGIKPEQADSRRIKPDEYVEFFVGILRVIFEDGCNGEKYRIAKR